MTGIIHRIHCQHLFLLNLLHAEVPEETCLYFISMKFERAEHASEESSLNPCDSNFGWKQMPPETSRLHPCWYPDRLMSARSRAKDCGFNTESGTDRLLFGLLLEL